MKRTIPCLAALLPALLAAVPASAGEGPQKIAVLDLQNDAKLEQGILVTLNEILLNEFHAAGKYEVLGSSDIASMLSLEEVRMQLGGCTDDSCIAEVGGALGVELMAMARVGAVGPQYVVSVKLLDVSVAKVADRASEMVARDDAQLIAAVRRAVGKVTGVAPLVDTTPTVDGSAQAEEPGPGFLDVAPWVALGLTVVAGGTGGAMAGLALKDAEARKDEFHGTPEWQDLKDSAQTKAVAADVLIGVGVAAGLATIFLFIFDSANEPAAAAAVVPTESGAYANLSLRFR